MTAPANPYDELPYRSYPIEWTAPERLALASLLHGGPRLPLEAYSVLELGCGDGANLLPLAYYRRHARFVGVDGARSRIEVAGERRSALGLSNVEFVHADFTAAARRLSGRLFDYIIAHGVFSWIAPEVRDALLDLVAQHLRPGGLAYLNYNTRPGWDVRGLVRGFLLAQTAGNDGLRVRAERAQEVSGKIVAALAGLDHPYSQLLANEFRFVHQGDITWVGHEFLALDNHPYWRSEFLALARHHRLEYVADADFNYGSGRVPENLTPQLVIEQIKGRSIEDTMDLLCYRQLHSPILTSGAFDRVPPGSSEFGKLLVASCLVPCTARDRGENRIFRHPTGYEVEAKENHIENGLIRLVPLWPQGARVESIFPEVDRAEDDLRLLHRNGLIELRLIEPGDCGIGGTLLNGLERAWAGYETSAYHCVTRVETAAIEVQS